MISRLVIAGGGPNFISHLGIMDEYLSSGLLDMNNVSSCYATSAGTVICILLCMRIPISELIEYFTYRPWDKWFKIDTTVFNMKCLCHSDALREAIRPFFDAYDIPIDITMSQFRVRFGTELHFFACELDSLEITDFTSATHPDLPVVDAGIMSASLPPLYPPLLYNGKYYVDGAFGNAFPVTECLKTCSPDEVLAIDNAYPQSNLDFDKISIFNVLSHILGVLVTKSNSNATNVASAHLCKHFISNMASSMLGADLWKHFLTSSETRKNMIESGRETVRKHFNKLTKPNIVEDLFLDVIVVNS